MPLYSLLQKTKQRSWEAPQQAAFKEAKRQLTSQNLLMYFDPSKELIVSCDASSYGLGAALLHVMPDGTEKSIAFTYVHPVPCQKLSQGMYTHLDKEGLTIIFGVKKFHQYLLGRPFTICSDHKPLQHIFAETCPIPSLVSAQLQR